MMFDDYPKQKPGIKSRYIGGETLLIDGELSYAINPPAAFIWELCDGEHSIADIEQAIREDFGVSPERSLHGEIVQTLIHFREKDLLVSHFCDYTDPD
ncbi:MAG: PqqD family protein [Anaerolineaceae bacterium]|nr:PqqD family protein [Anaerolineaceae bacterium]